MKKVLFVLESPHMGGTATSLLNLLSLWDSQEYEADLFFLHHTGPFLDRAKTLRLLPEERIISSILCPKSTLKQKGLCAVLVRLAFTLGHHLFGIPKTVQWFYRRSARKLSNKYDVVVAYQESTTTEYVQYIDAPARVAWCHMDYLTFSYGKSTQRQQQLYKHYRAIACVSDVIKQSMVDHLQLPSEQVHVVYNTIPPKFIHQMATEAEDTIETGAFTLVSCGRFVQRKRFDRVIKAALALHNKAIDFRWYLIGDGEEYDTIAQLTREYGLEKQLILTGPQNNPFRYIAKADCFVMTSESEGQPMVLNEAMTLGVPVITTNFPSAREVVLHEVNALLSPNTDDALVQSVLRFVCDSSLRETLKQGAIAFRYDNNSILKQIVGLLNQAHTGGSSS